MDIYDYTILLSFHVIFTFQGIYLFKKYFQYSKNPFTIVLNQVEYNSAIYSSLFILLFTILFFGFLNRKRLIVNPVKKIRKTQIYVYFLWIIFIILLFQKTGGLINTLINPGQSVGGQTILLMMVGIGRYPFLLSLAQKKTKPIELVVFVVTIMIVIINSRFLAITFLFEAILIYNYCVHRIKIYQILWASLVFIFIIFIYGLYREFSHRFETKDIESAIVYFEQVDINLVFDWFFAYNIEGYSGLANTINNINNKSNFSHDYGVSQLTSVFSLLPNDLKTSENFPFKEIINFLKAKSPNNGSVVPSSLEIYYGAFGVIGLLIYALIFSSLINFFKKKISQSRNESILLWVSLLSISLSGFRGNIVGILIYFGTISIFTFYTFTISNKIQWLKK